jgi:hypothetical protein
MADYLPQNSGLWSTTTWITAFSNLTAFAGSNTPPTVIDDVYADGKTITVDINTAVRTIRTSTTPRTGGLAGGGFRMNNGISLSANVIAGTTTCLSFLSSAPSTCTLFGGITGGTANSIFGFNNNSTGTVFIYGSEVTSGTGTGADGVVNNSVGTIFLSADVRGRQSTGLNNSSTGFVFITGNVFGSQIGGNVAGLNNNGTCTIYGNVAGGPQFAGGAGGNAYGVNNGASNSRLTVYGNVSGAAAVTGSGYGIYNLGAGAVVNILGNVHGFASDGVWNATATSVVSITGDVYGGAANSSAGLRNNVSNARAFVYGNAIGGPGATSYGVRGEGGSITYIYGSAIGGTGTSSSGAENRGSGGFMYITKAVGNNFGLGSVGFATASPGVAAVQNALTYVEQFEFGSRGATPISGPVYILPSNRNTLTGVLTALGNTVTFYNSLSVDGLIPPTSSVQLGTVYNVGNSVGTMVVPSASAVEFGVPVGNTVGVAALTPQTVWGYSRLSATDVGSMGDRLRNAATAQSVGSQMASFNL